MDIRQHMAWPWSSEKKFKNEAIELVAQEDRWNQEQGGDSAMNSPTGEQKNPQDAGTDESERLLVIISQVGQEYIKERISKILIDKIEQTAVKIEEEIIHWRS